VAKKVPNLVASDGALSVVEPRTSYEVIPYNAIAEEKLKERLKQAPEDERDAIAKEIARIRGQSRQGALATMALFPAFMFVCYLILIAYFTMRGGYKPIDLIKGQHAPPEGT